MTYKLKIENSFMTQQKALLSQKQSSSYRNYQNQVRRKRQLLQVLAQQQEPLLIRAAKQEKVERPPCWLMRQAGRYQKVFNDLSKKHPSFRERSENVDLCVEISLQPWESFKPDGVIIFSDILTPLPAFGVDFQISNQVGPQIEHPLRSKEDLTQYLHNIDLSKTEFVAKSLQTLRHHLNNQAGLIGFVGSPWTLATYMIEGKTSNHYQIIKKMAYDEPDLLKQILQFVAEQIAEYAKFQIRSGAQIIQIFDSWGGHLSPSLWSQFSQPYIQHIIQKVKQECPNVPIIAYALGSGGFLEKLADTGCDVVGVDWSVDMLDARRRINRDVAVQGNLDPIVLFASEKAIESSAKEVVQKAGNRGHILNLGHGVLQGTPEENVKLLFDISKTLHY